MVRLNPFLYSRAFRSVLFGICNRKVSNGQAAVAFPPQQDLKAF